MAYNSFIEWCKHTDNLWHGCSKVHRGCDHCYAETLSHRWKRDIWGDDKPRMAIKSVWNDFVKQQKEAAALNEIHRVFVGSMMDIFEKPFPLIDSKGLSIVIDKKEMCTDYLRDKYFNEVVPITPNLLHLMLTKRPSNIIRFTPREWRTNPPNNIMFGTSPADQPTFDNLWRHLAKITWAKKFLSIEPLLGPVTLRSYCLACNKLQDSLSHICSDCTRECVMPDWVIVGGESGFGARPMHPNWVKYIKLQCEDAGIPFLFKQWGAFRPATSIEDAQQHTLSLCYENGDWINSWGDPPLVQSMVMVGKKEAGRSLNGIEYNEIPKMIC